MTLKEKQDIETERYISRIIRAASRLSGAGIDEIDDASVRRKRIDVFGRTVAMVAVIHYVGLTHAATAKRFGYRDHTTVSYLLRKSKGDAQIENLVNKVLAEIDPNYVEEIAA